MRAVRVPRWKAVVQVPRYHKDPKVAKDVKRRTKFWAHDEFNLCSVGDIVRHGLRARKGSLREASARRALTVRAHRSPRGAQVRLEESRALSKRKAHLVAEIVKKEDGSPPPTPFPNM